MIKGEIEMLNLEYLSHFVIAAEYMNYTLAAERLFMNQSTLSRQMTALEEEFGVQLFIHNGRSIQLTQMGERLYEEGKMLLQHAESVKARVSTSRQKQVLIYMVPGVFESMDLVYAKMRKTYVDISINIRHFQSEDIMQIVENDVADFVIAYEPLLETNDNIQKLIIQQDGFCMVCAKQNKYAGRKSINFKECMDENVMFGEDFPLVLYEGKSSLKRRNVEEENAFSNNLETFRYRIRMNEGVIILPTNMSKIYCTDFEYIPISDKELTYNVVLMYKKNRNLSIGAELFQKTVKEYMGIHSS